jgi:hypothetical protein
LRENDFSFGVCHHAPGGACGREEGFGVEVRRLRARLSASCFRFPHRNRTLSHVTRGQTSRRFLMRVWSRQGAPSTGVITSALPRHCGIGQLLGWLDRRGSE